MQTVTQGRIHQYPPLRERRFEGDKRVNGFCLVISLGIHSPYIRVYKTGDPGGAGARASAEPE